MCNCNHKSRQDESKCCCDCHGKSNMKKACYSEKKSTPVEKPEETEYKQPYNPNKPNF